MRLLLPLLTQVLWSHLKVDERVVAVAATQHWVSDENGLRMARLRSRDEAGHVRLADSFAQYVERLHEYG